MLSPRCVAVLLAAVWSTAALPAQAATKAPPAGGLLQQLRQRAAKAPLVVAHRGDVEQQPENTLPAFAAALRIGAAIVELDCRQTRDGALVLLHDATLDRTTDSKRVFGADKVAVADRTAAELQQLDAGVHRGKPFAGIRLPTLAAALDLIQPQAVTMIEHKAGRAEDLVALLRARDQVDKVIVQSFDWDWLQRLHQLEPKLLLGALCGEPVTRERLDDVARTGARILHWDHRALRAEDVAEMQRRGYFVGVYTVDIDVALVGCGGLGLDFVTTNRPARLLELVAAGVVWRGGPGRK